ncbi:hypothetical protein [Clavibacter michiganensis]|uniref:hypothetical protein n=1 Tax=Clavibacter michiganensis TaxID=28447 RepID=UPI003EBFFDD6
MDGLSPRVADAASSSPLAVGPPGVERPSRRRAELMAGAVDAVDPAVLPGAVVEGAVVVLVLVGADVVAGVGVVVVGVGLVVGAGAGAAEREDELDFAVVTVNAAEAERVPAVAVIRMVESEVRGIVIAVVNLPVAVVVMRFVGRPDRDDRGLGGREAGAGDRHGCSDRPGGDGEDDRGGRRGDGPGRGGAGGDRRCDEHRGRHDRGCDGGDDGAFETAASGHGDRVLPPMDACERMFFVTLRPPDVRRATGSGGRG